MDWTQGIGGLFERYFADFGVFGCILILIATLATAFCYRGREGERYSLLNHFISELGERGVSQRAWVFNTGLSVGGLLILPFIVVLGLGLPGAWGWLAAIAGTVTTLACAAVGLFPMNYQRMKPHIIAAMTFFRAGLVMVLLFSAGILAQPAGSEWVPRWMLAFSGLAILAYASFLVMVRGGSALAGEGLPEDPADWPPRPPFRWLSVAEWAIFISTMLWLFAAALMKL